MDTSLLAFKEIPILIIGYGSLEQGDAYAGSLVAQIIQKLNLEDVEALNVERLTPSLAPIILKARTVIFIGSYYVCEHMNPEIIIKHFLHRNLEVDFDTGYDCSPQNLLAFIEAVYDRVPEAYWILIPAITYRLNDHLSTTTQTAIDKTLKYLTMGSHFDLFLKTKSLKESALNA
ncbi:hypothetical protein PCC7418_1980 [Halothece sp. PCC 7418]|uniref:hypothetical protein n=1 Tax=Halothece sp. (strain PCC 7418) TaxID=65093 RepID=UPI0002A07D59|nr:hypothetical protein [Halothece sp. PCC 7418]AFZ44146.1 hypothetical protein PCC7418_1980 [Halothece sp. PCC 7418]